MDVPAIRRHLRAWYARERRDLPWRGRDVYGVWVSEVMLQQTRVDVATPFYLRWMARWPTVEALAAATEDDVLAMWAGLGYYSRARNLHAAAKEIASNGWPADLEGWRKLPGVGPYTAAAVTSIALGQPNACVDGNVARVMARLTAEREPVGKAKAARRIADAAQACLDPTAPGDWNQAVMDLGASVCTPRAPRCGDCPLVAACAARAQGLEETIPLPKARTPARAERRHVAVVRHRGTVLVVRPTDGLLRGMWDLPSAPSRARLAAAVRRQTGVQVRLAHRSVTAVHRFSHRTWHLRVWPGAKVAAPAGPLLGGASWLRLSDVDSAAVPAATRVALAAAGIPLAATTNRARGATKAKTPPGSPPA